MHIRLLTLGAIFIVSLLLIQDFNCDDSVNNQLKHSTIVVPSAPHNLTVTKVTSTEIHLTWAKPSGYLTRIDNLAALQQSQEKRPIPLPPHAAASTSANQQLKKELLDIKSGDILSNRDSSLVGVLKETSHHHGGFVSRLTRNDKLYQDRKPVERDRGCSSEEVDNIFYRQWDENSRFFRRLKKRRDAPVTNVPSTTIPTTIPPNVEIKERKNEALIQQDESEELAAKRLRLEQEVLAEIENKLIKYVLFYEERFGGNSKNSSSSNSPQHGTRVKEVLLTVQHGKDGLKGAKFILKGLKPYTYYRIWIRAYFASANGHPSEPSATSLSPSSPAVVVLTDVPPPSPPIMKSLACDQPAGTMLLTWSRPEMFVGTLKAYEVIVKREGLSYTKVLLDTEEEHIETSISLPVDIKDNLTIYQVSLLAYSKSVVYPNVNINGTVSDEYEVIMTPDCGGNIIRFDHPINSDGDDMMIGSSNGGEVGYLVAIMALGAAILVVLFFIYRWGCTSAFKKCFPMSYLFLEDGGNGDGCGENGLSNKSDASGNQAKKTVSPAHAVVFWGNAENNSGTEPLITEQLWDPQHPPVVADMFLTHTAALHQDGDIGFSKEYELIQSRSALLGHTSHHSQHPDNRHKNRYLNITAYDHSRVCLLPNSGCTCEPGKEHRRSCDSKSSPQSGDSSPHCDYVNANFIDGIVSELDPELIKFIKDENEKRRIAQKKKEEVEAVKSEIEAKMAETEKMSQSQLPADLKLKLEHSIEAKNPSGYNTMDPRISLGPFKDKLNLDLDRKVTSPVLEIYPNTCRLSINLDKKEAERVETEVKNEKEKVVEKSKSKKRSTSADTRDIVIDKKASSRGHSKNSSVVVSNDSPSNGIQKIEGAFLNIEFSGIVDSERELQKAREAERLEEANRLAKEAAEETLEDLDDLYVKIDNESYRVKSSWLLDRRRYIGTQGPTPGTLRAFWKMVWDHRVGILVMITNLIERGRRKCDLYWPKEGNETYGVIQVAMLKEDVMATYTVRTFHIKNVKVGASRTVVQYHYTVWPDHGTPEHPLAVLRFREAARKAAQPGVVLVHCSAGVGRTGTYIVLDSMLNHLKLTGSLNVFGFLCHIRTQRNFLVQTEEQYVFIHDALLEAIQSGDTEVSAENAKDYLKKLLEPFPEGHIVDGGTINSKCGVYGVPLTDDEKKTTDVPNLLQHVRLRNVSTGESDFAMWDIDVVQRIKDESRNNELISMLSNDSVRNNIEDKRNSIENERNRRSSLKDQNGTKFITLEIEGDTKNDMDISPELVKDDQKIIDFDEGIVVNMGKGKNNTIKAEMGSMNSLNAKSENSNNSYEKLNGTCTKTSEESKASSMSNEEVELLPNECNEVKVNGNNSGKIDECNANGDHSNTVSSISSDTNNINGGNFHERTNYSPRLESQDSIDGYRNKNKIRNDDNYELISTNPRLMGMGLTSIIANNNNNGSTVNSIVTVAGSGGSDSYDGRPRYACQKRNMNGKKPRNLLEHQFKLITSFEPSKYHTSSASKMVNQCKNRRGSVWPVESSRVPLTPKPGEEGSDYINATWLQGHRLLKEYVVTQHPLPNTIEDLYRLLWDHTCQLLVVLTDTEDPECQQFWPTASNEEFNVYNYNIRFVSQERHIARVKRANGLLNPVASSRPNSISQCEEERRPTSLNIPSPSSSINRVPSNRDSQKSSPTSPNSEGHSSNPNQELPNSCLMRSNSNLEEAQDTNFYQQQTGDYQDEEQLIPKSEETPSLECDETRRLNSDTKTDGYVFDQSELRIETAAMVDENLVELRGKHSPNKIVANGDPFSPKDESKKSQAKSPSKISFKNFRISSPVLRSPTKFKFDFGARMSVNPKLPEPGDAQQNQDRVESPTPSMQIPETPSYETKFEMVPFTSPCQLRDNNEEIGKDCIITTTNLSMNSLQDDYELKVCLIECPKWLADLDYDENSDTDEGSEDDEYEMESKALNYVIEQRLKAYKGVFGLPEYIAKCQDEFKNSPVVVMDKFGGARATALCTLSSALRQSARDVYSLSKLHHGRRPGTWRRPADIRAMYEALAAYQQV